MNRFTLSLLPWWVLAGALLFSPAARGEIGPRVRPPSKAEFAAARTLFKRGVVVLIESDAQGELVQANIFGMINAPQQTVFDVLSDPSQLPDILPAVPADSIDLREKRGNAQNYRWRYGGSIMSVDGVTSQAAAPPLAVQWLLQKGFGPGQMLWRMEPEGNQTLVSLSLNI